MNSKIKGMVVLLLASSTLFAASSERMEVTFKTDKNGETTPKIFMPLYWSKTLYSGIGYENTSTMAISKDDSDKTLTAVKQDHIWINLLNYQSSAKSGFAYALGVGAEYRKFKKEEFSTLTYNSKINKTENSVKLDYMGTNINAELLYRDMFDFLSLRFASYVIPYSNLSVDQSTTIKPLITKEGTSKSSQSQDISYRMSVDCYIESGYGVDISLNARYEYLPLKYKAVEAGVKNSSAVFIPSLFQTSEKTTTLSAKIVLSKMEVGGMNPMLGLAQISHNDTFKSSTVTTTDISAEDENIFLFGFEKKF